MYLQCYFNYGEKTLEKRLKGRGPHVGGTLGGRPACVFLTVSLIL